MMTEPAAWAEADLSAADGCPPCSTPSSGDVAEWEAANGRFLGAGMAWLRLLLRRHAYRPGPVEPEDEVTEQEVGTAAEAMDRAARTEPPPALVALGQRLGLSQFERDVLLLCIAIELDPSIAALCARAHGGERMAYPTFGLALAALPDPAWEVLSPQGCLRYWRLVEINQPAGQPLVTSPLRADERIVNFAKGLNYLDDRLEPLVTRLGDDMDLDLPASQQAMADKVAGSWSHSSAAVIQLAGADEASKRLVAARAASYCGMVTYRLPSALLPDQPGELDNLARLWRREASLLPLALYLDADGPGPADTRPPVARFLDRLGTPAILAARESRPDLGGRSVVLDVEPPTAAEQAATWRAALGGDAPADLVESISGQFALDAATIKRIATQTTAAGGSDEVWRACRIHTRPRLDALAQRLQPKFTWDDIVLPDDVRALLRQIVDQVAHRSTVYGGWGFDVKTSRGLGVAALFAGPTGVGKTMAAEVIANHLRLDLYRVDLSAVVSKYIGETEKNLSRLFDAAEGGGVILFFDEADALFGRRTEVRDSHDRYANIEVNHLLQRMESYRGLAVLATNMRAALDHAFRRRLRFIVPFTFPDAAQRRLIWQRAFPPRAPLGDLDHDRLARLQASGAMIRNIAINAAFLAAGAGTPITMPLVLTAARSEFRKLELPIRERDFAWDDRAEPAP